MGTYRKERAAPLSVLMAQRRGIIKVDHARAVRLSGGHPLLLDAALSALSETPNASEEALIEALARSTPLWQSMMPLVVNPQTCAAISQRLEQSRLAPAQPYILDPFLRSLYWANLIAVRRWPDGAWLEWRCEAIRRAGALIVGAADQPQ